MTKKHIFNRIAGTVLSFLIICIMTVLTAVTGSAAILEGVFRTAEDSLLVDTAGGKADISFMITSDREEDWELNLLKEESTEDIPGHVLREYEGVIDTGNILDVQVSSEEEGVSFITEISVCENGQWRRPESDAPEDSDDELTDTTAQYCVEKGVSNVDVVIKASCDENEIACITFSFDVEGAASGFDGTVSGRTGEGFDETGMPVDDVDKKIMTGNLLPVIGAVIIGLGIGIIWIVSKKNEKKRSKE